VPSVPLRALSLRIIFGIEVVDVCIVILDRRPVMLAGFSVAVIGYVEPGLGLVLRIVGFGIVRVRVRARNS
jgi:hypothetical protein